MNDNYAEIACLRALLETVPGLLVLVDQDGRVAQTNRRQLLGEEIWEHLPGESVEGIQGALDEAFGAGISTEREIETRGLDGETRSFDLRVGPSGEDLASIALIEVKRSTRAQKLAAFVENSTDAVIMADAQGNIEEWNGAATALYGYSPSEILGESLRRLVPPELTHEIPTLMKAVREGRVGPHETVRLTKSGERIHVLLSLAGLFDGKKFLGAAAIARDVGAYHREAEALRAGNVELRQARDEVEGRLSSLLEQLPVGVTVTRDAVVFEANPAFCAMVGLAHEDVIGMHVGELVRPEARRTVVDRLEQIQSGELSVRPRGYELVEASGSTVPVETVSRPVRHREGDAILTVVHDLRARVEGEEARRRWETLYAGLLDVVNDAIVGVDGELAVRVYNQGAEAIFGHDPHAVMGTTLRELIVAPREIFGQLEMMTRASDRHDVLAPTRVEARRLGGERFVAEVSATRVEVDERAMLILILRDVTERENLEARLRRAQKMEAVGRVASGIAHEFNNALFVMSANLEESLGLIEAGDLARVGIENALEATARSATVVRELLDYTREEPEAEGECRAHALLTRGHAAYARLAGDKISIELELAAPHDRVPVAETRLDQIVTNVILNACAAMPEGTLRVHTHGSEEEFTLSITDTGAGIDEDVLPHLFEPFFTTKALGQGTGLGLAVVSSIVERSGGAIEVDSVLGRGTTFSFRWTTLPDTEDPTMPANPPRDSPTAPEDRRTILVVDDDDAVRRILVRSLKSAGYEVIEAVDGNAAWEILSTEEGIELLLTDHMMPGLTGAELATRARAIRQGVPTILLSGIGTKVEPHPQLRILSKPLSRVTLLDAVTSLLDGV